MCSRKQKPQLVRKVLVPTTFAKVFSDWLVKKCNCIKVSIFEKSERQILERWSENIEIVRFLKLNG